MYTAKNKVALMITANVFTIIPENTYNLRNYKISVIIMVLDYLFGRTVYHGTGSISYLGPKI